MTELELTNQLNEGETVKIEIQPHNPGLRYAIKKHGRLYFKKILLGNRHYAWYPSTKPSFKIIKRNGA